MDGQIVQEIEKHKRCIQGHEDNLKRSRVGALNQVLNEKTHNQANPEVSPKLHLHHLHAEYSQLKTKLNFEQTKYLLLQSIASEEEPCLNKIEAELKSTCKDLSSKKEQLQDVKNNIEDLSYKTEEDYGLLQSKVAVCNDLIDSVLAKKRDYGENTKTCLEMAALSEDKKANDEASHEAQALYKTKQDTACIMTEECRLIQEDINRLRQKAASLKQDVKTKELEAVTAKGIADRYEWCCKYLRVVEACSGFRVKAVTEDTLVVECAPDNEGRKDKPMLEIACVFDRAANHSTQASLKSVKVSEERLPLNDVVAAAIKMNDVPTLLLQVQMTWQLYQPILVEMESLRQRYAIDWVCGSRTVKVLCGRSANIVCTLVLPQRYPAEAGVTLQSVEGLPDQVAPDTLQVRGEGARLTEWLDHLHTALNEL